MVKWPGNNTEFCTTTNETTEAAGPRQAALFITFPCRRQHSAQVTALQTSAQPALYLGVDSVTVPLLWPKKPDACGEGRKGWFWLQVQGDRLEGNHDSEGTLDLESRSREQTGSGVRLSYLKVHPQGPTSSSQAPFSQGLQPPKSHPNDSSTSMADTGELKAWVQPNPHSKTLPPNQNNTAEDFQLMVKLWHLWGSMRLNC